MFIKPVCTVCSWMNPHPMYPLPVKPMNLFHVVGQDLKFLDGRLWRFEVKWDE